MVEFFILIINTTDYILDGSDDIIFFSSFKDALSGPIKGMGITYKKELKLISSFLTTLMNTLGINNIDFRRIIYFIAMNPI